MRAGAGMPRDFNDLLRASGISPTDVTLVRHHTKPGNGAKSLFELWDKDREKYELYQSTQRRDRPIFRTRKYWAAFVSPNPGATLFTGLYEARYQDTRRPEWLCPYRLGKVGEGEPVDFFETKRRPELSEHIGKLQIVWGSKSVRAWARYAENAAVPIVDDAATRIVSETPALAQALIQLGFERGHSTPDLVQLQRGDLVVYVDCRNSRILLIAHPRFLDLGGELSSLRAVKPSTGPCLHDGLIDFPIYEASGGGDPSRWGFALDLPLDQLENVVAVLERESVINTPEGEVRVIGTRDHPLTEREQLGAARMGQGTFRTALIAFWGTCPIVQVDHPELLRASHIKPWAKSSDPERLDPFNGLLLSPNLDLLFDRGLISFEDDGTLLFSSSLRG
jgi:hypothetical protein